MYRLFRTLDEIAALLRQQNLQQKELLTFDEACEYLGFKPSYLYKKSAAGELPSYTPTGRKLIFRRSELTEWALRNRRATHEELNQQAADYITKNPKHTTL
jgi:excisionase family DNA binding protein